jgi:uncharacterized protein (DUF58 family)
VKCAAIIAACVGLLLFGLFLLDWVIWIFIAPLILILFTSFLLFKNKEPSIELVREISNGKIFENDRAEITLKLKNKGHSIQFLEIFDKLPDRVSIEKGSNFSVTSFKQKEEFTIKYEIGCPVRGHYQIGPLYLRMRDFFGLFTIEKIIDDDAKLTVIPKVEDLKGFGSRSKSNPFPGIMRTNYAGSGMEFHGIRNYTPGDNFKKINWKAFARWNNIMVNEFEIDSTTDVIIILDSREIENIGALKHNSLEYSIKAAVALASHYLKKRDKVGIIIYGKSDGSLKWIYPESGKKQLYKIIKEIVETQPEGEYPLNPVINTASVHMLPRKSLVILISSLQADFTIAQAITKLIANKFNVLVLSPSPLDIEFQLKDYDQYYEIAYKTLKLERKNILSRLRSKGAIVVDWNPALPLSLSLKEVEQYRIKH